MFATQPLEALEAEVRDLERSSHAARQRVLQQRESMEATAREIGVAEEALAELGDRFPWHLDTLRMIRERLVTLQQTRDERSRTLRGAEEHLGRWEAQVVVGQQRLAKAHDERLSKQAVREAGLEVVAQPPRHTLPYGMPPISVSSGLAAPSQKRSDVDQINQVNQVDQVDRVDRVDRRVAVRPPALPRMSFDANAAIEAIDAGGLTLTPDSELMLEMVHELQATVDRLEQDNSQLRHRLGSVENNHVYLVKRLREQEGDLEQLRAGQQRLEERTPTKSHHDTWDRLDEADHDDLLFSEWEEELTPTVDPPSKALNAVRKKGVVSALDTSERDEDPELVFDEQFDRDVSALIRLMGKYQVERLDPSAAAN
jgi:hypothetical protein